MIIDKLENAVKYYGLSSSIKIALNFLKNTDLTRHPSGKFDIIFDKIYVIIQEYNTKPIADATLEAHKVYADVQFVISGSEKIGYSNINGLNILSEYDSDKDIMFFKEQGELLSLNQGDFAIFFPEDAHMPAVYTTESAKVKKAVIKIKI